MNSVHFFQDGKVKIELSDKRMFKLSAQNWLDLDHAKDDSLSEYQLEVLENASNYMKIREKILSLLAVREHSVFELQRKTKQKFFKSITKNFSNLFNRCIEEMQEKDFQSDERFTRHFVKFRILNKLQGPFKILNDLQSRGISRELAEDILAEIGSHEIWIKKTIDCLEYLLKKNKKLFDVSYRQKLYQRGFPWEIIQEALEQHKISSNNLDD